MILHDAAKVGRQSFSVTWRLQQAGPTIIDRVHDAVVRAPVGEVKLHAYPARYADADVWLHDFCVAAFEATETARSTAMAAEDDAEMISATARKAADAADANPITVAWDAANDAQRQEFVKLRGVEIGQADPFAVPTFLRRAP